MSGNPKPTVSPMDIWKALNPLVRAQSLVNGASSAPSQPPPTSGFNAPANPTSNGSGEPEYFHPIGNAPHQQQQPQQQQQPAPYRYGVPPPGSGMPYPYQSGFSNFNSAINTPGTQTPIDLGRSGNVTPTLPSGMMTPTDNQNTAMDTAYAKLLGDNFAYYVQTMSVVLGRRTKSASTDVKQEQAEGEPDVDLGPSKSISRRHATIRYDTAAEAFFIQAHGKNGMQVDLIFYKCDCEPVQLYNGSRIQIANVGFWFFLPQGQLQRNTQPLINAAQLHLRYLASRSPSPAPTITQPNSRVPSRGASPIDDHRMPSSKKAKTSRRSSSESKSMGRGTRKSVDTARMSSYGGGGGVKPSLTYAELIIEALEENGGRLNLKAIYAAITDKYSYYRTLEDQDGWKNSIRHNLSLNAGFQKTKRLDHEPVVKGNYWVYEPKGNKGGGHGTLPSHGYSQGHALGPQRTTKVSPKKASKRARRKSAGQSSSLRHMHSVGLSTTDEYDDSISRNNSDE